MEKFKNTHSYKLIYIYTIPYADHNGMVKVGETTLDSAADPKTLLPNCKELNKAARDRIKGSLGTASVQYDLKHTELALREQKGQLESFSDKTVHRVLLNSGIKRGKPNGETGFEWFKTTVDVAKNAIQAVKEGRQTLTGKDFKEARVAIDFREEQKDAIKQTIKAFKSHNEMLWYAKMRFGKTLTALEVVRQLQYRRVIIATHRPVVNDGWGTDFKKIFFEGNSKNNYTYFGKIAESDKDSAQSDAGNDKHLAQLDKGGKHFIYFTSIQDLRGSQRVGGKFNKNNAVFDLDWDLIIIDEAHEGTQTSLGDDVIKKLRKEKTKILSLSGTPFNLLDKYTEANTYTWDYVMEQKRKLEWDLMHHGDHNPYADLPQMHIYTYDLSAKLKAYVSDEYGSKAFNFREFFRVHVSGAQEGRFVHEKDVEAFLNLLVQNDANSEYPYATSAYRNIFRHTLWMIPGVKEARALSELLRKHPVFGSDEFGIANVAGEGDDYEDTHAKDALNLVRNTIEKNRYSITLSCGKLTTGVTVPEWTAVFMLSGSYSTAASQYLQTIFRVQSAGCIEGKQKTDCYVFDFAPDRTLKVLSETVHLSRKPGKSDVKRRQAMQEFLNFCPVISIAGSKMTAYSVNSMMEQLKQIYAERAVNSGFDDESIYNDELLKLDHLAAEQFNKLKDIIGASKASAKKDSVVVNDKGLTQAELEKAEAEDNDDQPGPPTPEELERRRKMREAREARKKAIDILRGISIRMPLLIYGADVELDEEIDIDDFVKIVDDSSWAEFMPAGVTKEIFATFTKYYDRDIFIAAGKRIRRLAAEADCGSPTVRVHKLAEVFSKFKNPDKETVLTPWRVVNLHLSETIGGWNFFKDNKEDTPHFVEQAETTATIFRKDGKVLEINSKTGLYPLYVAYSFYRQQLDGKLEKDYEPEHLQAVWDTVIRENVYVICKTPMAKSITARTLRGYRPVKVNTHYFEDLINMLKNKPNQFKKKVLKGSYWGKKEVEMKFDAVVGNPPYQEMTEGTSDKPVYNHFMDMSFSLSDRATLITPARFLFGAGKTPKEWNEKILSDKHLKVVYYTPNSTDVFPNVDIKGGVTITYRDSSTDFGAIGAFSPYPELQSILKKVSSAKEFQSIRDDIYLQNKFNLMNLYADFPHLRNRIGSQGKEQRFTTSIFELTEVFKDRRENKDDIEVLGLIKNVRIRRFINKKYCQKHENLLKYKILVPKSNGTGAIGEVLSTPVIGQPVIGHTQTFLSIGKFETEEEAKACYKYICSKFARCMLGVLKVTQDNPPDTWAYVPLQDFTDASDIDWSKTIPEIDQLLYQKYNLSQEEITFIESKIKPME